MKIGVIADTHGILHPHVTEIFLGVDRIVHAGDIQGKDSRQAEIILKTLRQLAPVDAVRGNYDKKPIPGVMEDPAWIELQGHKVLVTHRMISFAWEASYTLIKEMIGRINNPPRIVIFGHTHVPVAQEIENVFFMNPGYAGPDQYEADYTVGILNINGNDITGEIIKLDRIDLAD